MTSENSENDDTWPNGLAAGKANIRRAFFDSIASKRVLKTGYVRQPGGLYPSECDTVAAHSHAVTSLAALIAYEIAADLERECHVRLDLESLLLLSVFHDHAETRSGDTGAQSMAIYGACQLYNLEVDALRTMMKGFRLAPRILHLYDGYRTYSTAEALVVHAADALEGFEKAAGHFHRSSEAMDDAFHILSENLRIFRGRQESFPGEAGENLSKVGCYLAEYVIIPIATLIGQTYRLDLERLRRITGERAND